MKKTKILFYIFTGIFSLAMLGGAFAELTFSETAVAQFIHLGYPLYLLYILGIAKILGVIGIWQNKIETLREWAYAGFFIDILGALASHIFVGDSVKEYGFALVMLAILSISYFNFKKLKNNN